MRVGLASDIHPDDFVRGFLDEWCAKAGVRPDIVEDIFICRSFCRDDRVIVRTVGGRLIIKDIPSPLKGLIGA